MYLQKQKKYVIESSGGSVRKAVLGTDRRITGEGTKHSVYTVECADGTYYTGIATDVPRWLLEHNGAESNGAPLHIGLVAGLGVRGAVRITVRRT